MNHTASVGRSHGSTRYTVRRSFHGQRTARDVVAALVAIHQ